MTRINATQGLVALTLTPFEQFLSYARLQADMELKRSKIQAEISLKSQQIEAEYLLKEKERLQK